jgi:DNA-binding transcriptional LysR family regulator
MRYDLTDLRLLVAVADEGNVSRGAAACFLAPSSASLRIRHLEETLGVELFVRQPRGVALTRAGQVMLQHCRRCLAELEQMHADLAPYARGVKGQVTLFANSTAVASYLPADLAAFLADRPSVRVQLEERLSHEIVAAVAEGRAELGIVTWQDEHPDLVFRSYRQDELVAIVPAGAKVGQKRGVKFLDLLAHPFVSLASGTAIHTFLANKAAALSQHMDVRVQVASFGAVLSLVASGVGVAIVPRSVVPVEQDLAMKVVPLLETWAVRELRVCWRRDETRQSDHVRALLRQLCGEGEDVAA